MVSEGMDAPVNVKLRVLSGCSANILRAITFPRKTLLGLLKHLGTSEIGASARRLYKVYSVCC